MQNRLHYVADDLHDSWPASFEWDSVIELILEYTVLDSPAVQSKPRPLHRVDSGAGFLRQTATERVSRSRAAEPEPDPC